MINKEKKREINFIMLKSIDCCIYAELTKTF